jgi:hypothetical protein
MNNKGQECKTGPFQGWLLLGGDGQTERVKDELYIFVWCTLYTCMKRERWNCFKKRGREHDGEDESNQGIS